jgi:hypothetical protein
MLVSTPYFKEDSGAGQDKNQLSLKLFASIRGDSDTIFPGNPKLAGVTHMRRLVRTISIVFAFIGVFTAAFIWLIRPWYLYWGAAQAEVNKAQPGDDFIPVSVGGHTRAISINAPASEIWPWLVQIGADKGGFYSHTWIEGMIGCPITNADRIHPEWQNLKAGDLMRMCVSDPAPPPYEVIEVLSDRALVLGHRATEADLLGDVGWFDTWTFILEPVNANTTRLIARSRNAKNVAWMRIIEPGFFIMESGMLKGIKGRAEGD